MMHPYTPARLSIPLAGLALVLVAAGLGCCTCEDLTKLQTIEHVGTIAKIDTIEVVEIVEPQADHWLVIHDRNEVETDNDGNSIGCVLESQVEKTTFLPECLHAKVGETLGIANYSATDVDIAHYSTLDAPASIHLESGEKEVFDVIGGSQIFDITSSDHGGPEMIVQP